MLQWFVAKTPRGRPREVEAGHVEDQPLNGKTKETKQHIHLSGPVKKTKNMPYRKVD